jgi:hypothetical protein
LAGWPLSPVVSVVRHNNTTLVTTGACVMVANEEKEGLTWVAGPCRLLCQWHGTTTQLR